MTENIYQDYAAQAERSGSSEDPIQVEGVPWATPVTGPPPPPDGGKRDACAVGSAVCGFTGFIPVVTQVIGLVLGILAVGRIRRARLFGQQRGGMKHAVVGIITNGATLLIWVLVFVALSSVFRSVAGTAADLSKLVPRQ